MARSRSAASLVVSRDAEYREIERWYRDELAHTVPRSGLRWDPVRIGPTWQWSPKSGWLLPAVSLGWGVLSWCGYWLRHNGEPWQFTMEQARFLLWFYALEPSNLVFMSHSAVFQRLKGHGKDPLASCVSAVSAFGPVNFDRWDGDRPVGRDEPDAWVQICAVSLDQTKNTMKLFPSLIPAETRKHYGIQIGKQNIWGLGDTRQIEAVTASPLAIEGGRPKLVVRAETQNWNASNGGHDMAGALEGNAAKSAVGAQARMLDICNAYRPGEDSVGERMREAWEATQSTEHRGALMRDFGVMYDSLEAPPEAPLTAEAAPAVVEAIAGDSYWLDTRPDGRIVKSILNPANPPSESRRKWFNQITATADAWVDPQWWDAMRPDMPEPADGEDVFLFFDGSKSDDSTALIGCHEPTGNVFVVGIWQRPANADSWLVDRADVDLRARGALARWHVIGCWGDPSDARDDDTGERFWEDVLDGWARDFEFELPAVKDGISKHRVIWDMRNARHLSAHTEECERCATDIKAGTFRHDGNKLLQQHVRNARRRPNKFGIGIGKEHRESRRKVDAAVCVVGARLMWRQWQMVKPKARTGEAAFF